MNRKEYRKQILANEPTDLKLQRLQRRYKRILMGLCKVLPEKKKPCTLVLAKLQKDWLQLESRQAYHEGAKLAAGVYCDFIRKEGLI